MEGAKRARRWGQFGRWADVGRRPAHQQSRRWRLRESLGIMAASGRGRRRKDVPEWDTRDNVARETGGDITADNQGLSADGAGVLLPPGVRVGGVGVGRWGRGGWLAVGQAVAAAVVGLFFGVTAGIESIVAHGLIAGGGHMLQRAAQKLVDRERLGLVALAEAGVRVVGPPAKGDLPVLRVWGFQSAGAHGGGFEVEELGVAQVPIRRGGGRRNLKTDRREGAAGNIVGQVRLNDRGRGSTVFRGFRDKDLPLLTVDLVDAMHPISGGGARRQGEGLRVVWGGFFVVLLLEDLFQVPAEAFTAFPHQGFDAHETARMGDVDPLALRT